jgi:hypothetical protein
MRRAGRFGRWPWAVALLLVIIAGVNRFASGNGSAHAATRHCSGEIAAAYRVCPSAEDTSYPYINSITFEPASNGIAVTFTDAGMAYAATCEGAGELATGIARLFEQFPQERRTENRIDWAIPQMTGEITGHARMYLATSNERIRNRANPVNIVFGEYRGKFPGGMAGVNARAQQAVYASFCPAPADPAG